MKPLRIQLVKLYFILFLLIVVKSKATGANFSGETIISGNLITCGFWSSSPSPSPSSSPLPSELPSPSSSPSPDTTPPTTILTVDDGLSVEEKVVNGGFEEGGSIASWQENGTTKRVGADEEFNVNPVQASYMARVGDFEDPGQFVWQNSLGQNINFGNKNLSFYYNFYSYDDFLDVPACMLIINDQTVWDLNSYDLGWHLGYYDYPNYSGWQKNYVDLTRFGANPLNTSFYSGNIGDDQLQSWVYLDKLTTTEIVAKKDTKFYLITEPEAISYYQVQENEEPLSNLSWRILNDDFFTLESHSSGDYTIYYRSRDEAGNVEEPKSAKVLLDKITPVRIDDLSATALSNSSVWLMWTATYDNGERLAFYDIRFWEKGEAECDESSWDAPATQRVLYPPMPRFPGEIQSFQIDNMLTDMTYCIGIKTCDTALNCSVISHNPSADIETVTTLEQETGQENSREVVFNELMWMGSKEAGIYDEWIEFKNTTDQDVNMSDWQIVKKKSDGTKECMYTFPAGTVIKAQDYLVVSEYDSIHSAFNIDCPSENCLVVGTGADNNQDFTLANSKLQLKLYSGNWVVPGIKVIDVADDGIGEPAAGDYDSDGSIYFSMERDSFPGNGALVDNWHTCLDESSTLSFWDSDSVDRGTPGSFNLSINPQLNFYLSTDKKNVSFKIAGIDSFNKLNYEITYFPTNREPQGILGEIDLHKDEEVISKDFALGTASDNDWIYDTGMTKIFLEMILSGDNLPDLKLEKELFY